MKTKPSFKLFNKLQESITEITQSVITQYVVDVMSEKLEKFKYLEMMIEDMKDSDLELFKEAKKEKHKFKAEIHLERARLLRSILELVREINN